jgi:hypothetical protein
MRTAIERLAAAYWRTMTDKSTQAFLSWEAVHALCRLPGVGSRFVVAMARHADLGASGSIAEERCAYLGAGPLEDLVSRGDREDLVVIESALSTSAELRRALHAVNPPDDPKVAQWLASHR